MLPVAVRERMQAHLSVVKRQHEHDLAHGTGRVVLPFALDRKYPNAATDWAWQFVFPAGRMCRDSRWGPPSRYHLHETVVQKAVAEAVRDAGLVKRASPHTFRHCFTTHLFADEYDILTPRAARAQGREHARDDHAIVGIVARAPRTASERIGRVPTDCGRSC